MSNSKVKNRVLIFTGIVIGCIIIYLIFVYPFILNKRVTGKLEIEEQRLANYLKLINQKPEKDIKLEELHEKIDKYKSMLLESDKPPVVAAMLQNTLKEMAENEGINIISERQLNIEEKGLFLKIPVEVTLRSSITKLTNFVYSIEDYNKFLDISDINISVINIRKPEDVKASITVSGYILAQEPSKEG